MIETLHNPPYQTIRLHLPPSPVCCRWKSVAQSCGVRCTDQFTAKLAKSEVYPKRSAEIHITPRPDRVENPEKLP